ncbi:LysR family transcriptional regulator [Shewanella sp. YLB-07]|uniref:LysR family transcriptional regulator n=1 Tax=Shewanella sp. YLB-07 TaxID=2601268 RepID=UPI00128AFC8C|nr:LysR family transcriptional regulator [Shewanella sp. YLB-07]MPY26129.1 LysR family transcriptional regulator [Shewanella sp. YLB-07]
MKIQLESLISFITAADTGSFSAAGRKLKKSQAGISLSIQNLEIDLGFTLFDRNGKYPLLTQQGELVLKDARLLMSQYSTFVERSKFISRVEQVKLSIGIDPLVCCQEVKDIILRFSEVFPAVELTIVQRSSESLAQKLADKTLEFALGLFGRDVEKTFENMSAFQLDSCWVVSPSYSLAQNLQHDDVDPRAIKIDRATFNQSRILLPSETPLAGFYEVSLTKKIWYVEDIHTLLSFCRNGLGIAFLPSFVVAHDLENGSLNKIFLEKDQSRSRDWRSSLIFTVGHQKSPAVEWLTQQLLNI